jgi:hypothetical protein
MEYHKHISTLPIANWFKLNESGNIGYLLKCDFFEVDEIAKQLTEDDAKLLVDVAKQMPYQFDNVDTEFIEMDKNIAYFNLQYIVTDEKDYLNRATIAEKKKEKKVNQLSQLKPMSLEDQTAILETHWKLHIDIYTTSTARWFSYKNLYLNQNKPANE